VKLLGLHLLAYGPFTDVRLDLGPQGLHVVYGKNEAGKSTALRAITGLLYGIARNTTDDHVHKMPDLRIGGSFGVPEGGSLYLVRRKGKDNTLLDREGRPVDEAVLARLLGGVSEEQFLTMFGLDHETLRRGGEALLSGKGNVGESLFGAAVAGGEVHQVLRALRDETDALFTPKAHTRPLNEALKTWTEAHRRTRDESMSAESMLEQEKHLADLKRERALCEADRQRRELERAKLGRACHALPVVHRRKLAAEKRAAMGDVARLPQSASSERVEQLRVLHEAKTETARLDAFVSDLRAKRAALDVPESLVAYDELPLDLGDRLGSHRKAARDVPRIHAEVEELEREARARLCDAGREVDLADAEAWRLDAVTQASFRKLAHEKSALVEARQRTERALEERRARRSALAFRKDQMAKAPDVAALKKTAARAERAGPLDERLATAVAQATRIERRAELQLSALGLSSLSLEAATGLAVVPEETVERFARSRASLDREEESIAKQMGELEAESAKLARDIEALEIEGKVPTERDLSAARERRDASLERVRRALASRAKESRGDVLAAFEKEMQKADDVADRLRREAERVGKLAAFLAGQEANVQRRAALDAKKTEIVARRWADDDAWGAAWRNAGVEPRAPTEMKAWLLAHAAFVRTFEELAATRAEIDALRESIRKHGEPLARWLEEQGSPAPAGAPLGHLLDRASQIIETADAAQAERREIERNLDDIDGQLASLVAEEREQMRTHDRLEKSWSEATAALGLERDATPDQVTLTMDLLVEMFHKIDQARAARRRADGIERDAKAFADDVVAFAREHAPDLAERPAEDAAAAILDRYHRGRTDLAERRGIDARLVETTEMLAHQEARARAAETRLGELMAAAEVSDVEALERAEARAAEARELDRQTADLDAELGRLGLDPDALPDEMRDLDADVASLRLEEVEGELEQLRQQLSVLDQRIGGHEGGQRKLEDPRANAAEAALDAEAALASAREIAERYARVKIASVVLGREIERYRRENQGPILSRASVLFARLTLGSFSGLKTDFDDKDQPILVGIRGGASSRDVHVEEMSDGTRDQLYLALYLATLERVARAGDPMPLIVDDVLIHFDDDRARAALEVLGELSLHTQVLFFTHHARLVELAREAIPRERLFIRELEGTPGSKAAQA
jgi:uncharacterized protein YhaN